MPRDPNTYDEQFDQERLAADIVVFLTGSVGWENLDDGTGGDNCRDFDLVFGDGHREALEITTSSRDQKAIAQDSAATSGKYDFSLPDCTNDWSVRVKPSGVSIKRLAAGLAPLLAELEALGVTSTGWPRPQPGEPVGDVLEKLDRLGVRHVLRSNPTEHPRAHIQPASGGTFGPDEVTDAVQAEIDNDGNRSKLARGGLARRHLFVWVHWVGGPSFAAFNSISDPTTAPVLNDAVTTVWGAPEGAEFDGRDLYTEVWESDGGPWKRHAHHPVLVSDWVAQNP